MAKSTWKRAGDSIEIESSFEYRVPKDGHYVFHTGGGHEMSLPTKVMRLKSNPKKLYEVAEVMFESQDEDSVFARLHGSKAKEWVSIKKANLLPLDKDDMAAILYEDDDDA